MNNNVSKKVTEEQNKIVTNYHGAAAGLYIISQNNKNYILEQFDII